MEYGTHKICTRCGEEKPINDFHRAPRIKNGVLREFRRGYCRDCRSKERSITRHARPQRPRLIKESGITVKLCSRCKVEKPTSEFYRQNDARRSLYPYCKPCENEKQREHRAANPKPKRPKSLTKKCTRCKVEFPLNEFKLRSKWNEEKTKQYFYRSSSCRACHRVRHGDAHKRRRARIMNSPRIEVIDRSVIIGRDKSTCYLCGNILTNATEITLDHVIPLASGGAHTADNLRVACRDCNFRKNKRTLEEFLALQQRSTTMARQR
jgi:hypothetical protein